MRNLSATYKGLITGLLMVGFSLVIYYNYKSFESPLQYFTYAIYAAGIAWALIAYSRMPHAIRTFRTYFSQGFKCFIVVTLIMVSFTYIFLKSDPSIKEEMAVNNRAYMEKKGNYTPAEIETSVANSKEYFVTISTSATIFRYLLIGAIITAITGGILIQVKGRDIDQTHTSYTGTKI